MTIQSLKTTFNTACTSLHSIPDYLSDMMTWAGGGESSAKAAYNRLFGLPVFNSRHFDDVDHWIYKKLAAAEKIGTDGTTDGAKLLDADTLIGQVGLPNAIALLLRCYMLAYKSVNARGQAADASAALAMKQFREKLQALQARYPAEFSRHIAAVTSPTGQAMFDKSAVSADCLRELAAAAADRTRLYRNVGLAALGTLATATAGYYAWHNFMGDRSPDNHTEPSDTEVSMPSSNPAGVCTRTPAFEQIILQACPADAYVNAGTAALSPDSATQCPWNTSVAAAATTPAITMPSNGSTPGEASTNTSAAGDASTPIFSAEVPLASAPAWQIAQTVGAIAGAMLGVGGVIGHMATLYKRAKALNKEEQAPSTEMADTMAHKLAAAARNAVGVESGYKQVPVANGLRVSPPKASASSSGLPAHGINSGLLTHRPELVAPVPKSIDSGEVLPWVKTMDLPIVINLLNEANPFREGAPEAFGSAPKKIISGLLTDRSAENKVKGAATQFGLVLDQLRGHSRFNIGKSLSSVSPRSTELNEGGSNLSSPSGSPPLTPTHGAGGLYDHLVVQVPTSPSTATAFSLVSSAGNVNFHFDLDSTRNSADVRSSVANQDVAQISTAPSTPSPVARSIVSTSPADKSSPTPPRGGSLVSPVLGQYKKTHRYSFVDVKAGERRQTGNADFSPGPSTPPAQIRTAISRPLTPFISNRGNVGSAGEQKGGDIASTALNAFSVAPEDLAQLAWYVNRAERVAAEQHRSAHRKDPTYKDGLGGMLSPLAEDNALDSLQAPAGSAGYDLSINDYQNLKDLLSKLNARDQAPVSSSSVSQQSLLSKLQHVLKPLYYGITTELQILCHDLDHLITDKNNIKKEITPELQRKMNTIARKRARLDMLEKIAGNILNSAEFNNQSTVSTPSANSREIEQLKESLHRWQESIDEMAGFITQGWMGKSMLDKPKEQARNLRGKLREKGFEVQTPKSPEYQPVASGSPSTAEQNLAKLLVFSPSSPNTIIPEDSEQEDVVDADFLDAWRQQLVAMQAAWNKTVDDHQSYSQQPSGMSSARGSSAAEEKDAGQSLPAVVDDGMNELASFANNFVNENGRSAVLARDDALAATYDPLLATPLSDSILGISRESRISAAGSRAGSANNSGYISPETSFPASSQARSMIPQQLASVFEASRSQPATPVKQAESSALPSPQSRTSPEAPLSESGRSRSSPSPIPSPSFSSMNLDSAVADGEDDGERNEGVAEAEENEVQGNASGLQFQQPSPLRPVAAPAAAPMSPESPPQVETRSWTDSALGALGWFFENLGTPPKMNRNKGMGFPFGSPESDSSSRRWTDD